MNLWNDHGFVWATDNPNLYEHANRIINVFVLNDLLFFQD
jgi:hypothetical protein